MKTIPLTHNQTAIIDDADFERVSAHNWYAHKRRRGRRHHRTAPTGSTLTEASDGVCGATAHGVSGCPDSPAGAGPAPRECWYAATSIAGRTVSLHSFILGHRPGLEIDHINNDGLDNRRANLRHATHRQNCHNSLGRVNHRRSRFKGVSWTGAAAYARTPWRAIISVAGQTANPRIFRNRGVCCPQLQPRGKLGLGRVCKAKYVVRIREGIQSVSFPRRV